MTINWCVCTKFWKVLRDSQLLKVIAHGLTIKLSSQVIPVFLWSLPGHRLPAWYLQLIHVINARRELARNGKPNTTTSAVLRYSSVRFVLPWAYCQSDEILRMFTLLIEPRFICIPKARDVYERNCTGCEYLECSIDTNPTTKVRQVGQSIVEISTCLLDARQMTRARKPRIVSTVIRDLKFVTHWPPRCNAWVRSQIRPKLCMVQIRIKLWFLITTFLYFQFVEAYATYRDLSSELGRYSLMLKKCMYILFRRGER